MVLRARIVFFHLCTSRWFELEEAQETFALMNSSLPQKQCAPDLRKEKKLFPKIIKLLSQIQIISPLT